MYDSSSPIVASDIFLQAPRDDYEKEACSDWEKVGSHVLEGRPADCSGAHLMSIWSGQPGSTYPKVAKTGLAGGRGVFQFGGGRKVSQKIALVCCWTLTDGSGSATTPSSYGMMSLNCRRHRHCHTVRKMLSIFATEPFTSLVRPQRAALRRVGITKWTLAALIQE